MEDNGNLNNRITALEKWKAEKEAQQIKFPLDVQSVAILNKYFMRIDNAILYEVVGAAAHPVQLYLGNQDGQTFQVTPQTIYQYSVNVSSNQLTVTQNNSFYEDQEVHVYSTPTGSFPSPLAVNTTYFIKNLSKNSSGTTFVLSLTSGGATINITTTGDGAQYIEPNF